MAATDDFDPVIAAVYAVRLYDRLAPNEITRARRVSEIVALLRRVGREQRNQEAAPLAEAIAEAYRRRPEI